MAFSVKKNKRTHYNENIQQNHQITKEVFAYVESAGLKEAEDIIQPNQRSKKYPKKLLSSVIFLFLLFPVFVAFIYFAIVHKTLFKLSVAFYSLQ